MQDGEFEAAFGSWRRTLQQLTSTEDAARTWRRDRYRFAYRLGRALVGSGEPGQSPVTGHVVYGVWLDGDRLIYVGHTSEAERRLRDLAVGESNHLANTFPPEIWHRVVVVAWPRLPQAASLPPALRPLDVGRGLEHRLQDWRAPLANASHRTRDGGWREVDWKTSRSVGARIGPQIDELFTAVQQAWLDAEHLQQGSETRSEVYRVVFPGQLLQ